MRFTIAKQFAAMSVMAILLAVSVWWYGLAVLLATALLPVIVFRLEIPRKSRHPIQSIGIIISSLLPLYVASLGPYYRLYFHAHGAHIAGQDALAAFYWPLFYVLKFNDNRLLTPLFEYYLIDWI